jgi:triphosphoribosyl-dephospho-CoA synthetase
VSTDQTRRRAAFDRAGASDLNRRLTVLASVLRAVSEFAAETVEGHGRGCRCDYCRFHGREAVKTMTRDVNGVDYNCLMAAEILPTWGELELVPGVQEYLESLVADAGTNGGLPVPSASAPGRAK